jgi:hypothetical protein
MDAVLGTIVDGGPAIIVINREVGRNKLITCYIYNLILNPSNAALPNPFCRGSRGCSIFVHQNHAAGGENGSSWWGCV